MKYKIWDKKERIYTPSGHSFSAEEWLDRYAWAKNDDVKCVISAGKINGALMLEFESMIDQYKKMGCPIDEKTMTDEEILQAIETFENTPVEPEPSVEERAIALEEFKAMVTVEGYVPPKEIVEKNFKRGLWSEVMLDVAVTKNSISKTDKANIIKSKTQNNVLK